MDSFIAQTNSWWGILRQKALGIFKIVVVIDVCLFGFRMAMPGSDVAEIFKEFVSLLVFAGFIALVIVNYEDWSKAVAINGLTSIASDLTNESFSIDKPFEIARKVWDKTYEVSTSVELNQLPLVMIYMLAAGFLIISMFFLCALMIMAKCEFYIVANVGVLLIGLGGSKIFKDYATNVMRYVLSIGVKIFVIQLLANVGLAMIDVNNVVIGGGDGPAAISWPRLYVLVAMTLILIVLAKTLPDSCAGMISGATVGGGNPLAAAAMGVGGVVGARVVSGAIAAGRAGAGAASAVKSSYDTARARGAEGVLGKVQGMGQAFSEAWSSAKDARKAGKEARIQSNLEQAPGSMMNQLRSQASMARARQAAGMDGGGGVSSAGAPVMPATASQTLGTAPVSPSNGTAAVPGGVQNTPPASPATTNTPLSQTPPERPSAPLPPSPQEAAATKRGPKTVDMRQP